MRAQLQIPDMAICVSTSDQIAQQFADISHAVQLKKLSAAARTVSLTAAALHCARSLLLSRREHGSGLGHRFQPHANQNERSANAA